MASRHTSICILGFRVLFGSVDFVPNDFGIVAERSFALDWVSSFASLDMILKGKNQKIPHYSQTNKNGFFYENLFEGYAIGIIRQIVLDTTLSKWYPRLEREIDRSSCRQSQRDPTMIASRGQ